MIVANEGQAWGCHTEHAKRHPGSDDCNPAQGGHLNGYPKIRFMESGYLGYLC